MIKKSIGIALLLAVFLTAGCSAPSANPAGSTGKVQASDSQTPDASGEGLTVTPESLGLADGQYQVEVSLSGGSGRAGVASPAQLRVKDGQAFATIVWSSSNYDYMKVSGEKYEPITTEEHSAFEIPVTGFDCELPVIADTVAMSEPHEIDYTLQFDSATITAVKAAPAA